MITRKSFNIETPAFENAAKYSNVLCIAVVAKFGEVGSTHPWEPIGKSSPPHKIERFFR